MSSTTAIKGMQWFERKFTFGLPATMLPFYLERLEGTTVRMIAKLKGVPEELLSVKLDGKWSIKQNIGHLSDVDEIALNRIGEIVNGISPLSPAVFEPRGNYNEMSIGDVVNTFRVNRNRNVSRYKNLTLHDLEKNSLHPRLQVPMTAVDLAWFDAEHDDHHLVRINEILTELLK